MHELSFFTLPFCIFACIQYELNVVASDSLHETSTRVVIHVRDVNDLPPVFDQGTYIANTVEEYAAPKRRILKVESCCAPSSCCRGGGGDGVCGGRSK